MNDYIKSFQDIRLKDVPIVGGKNASLGEMFNELSQHGIQVPNGFATTADAFRDFLQENKLTEGLTQLLHHLDRTNFSNLKAIGLQARTMLLEAHLSEALKQEIVTHYEQLVGRGAPDVAVRSSATAEDLPEASFAGQHESFLNIKGSEALLTAVHQCFVSLYTDRAIKYREDNGFEHTKVAISVGIQKMVRSDLACSGVIFSLEPESGFRDIIHISGVWGLGENIVQGTVIPDEFLVFKPTLRQGFHAIVQKKLGEKEKTLIYRQGEKDPTLNILTPQEKRDQFVLSDQEITQLAQWTLRIESHYHQPMDIEWAKDGNTEQLYILQARPETIHSQKNPLLQKEYKLAKKGTVLCSGQAIGTKIATGIARLLHSPSESGKLQPGDIVVTTYTSPDWDPILKRSAAIITDKGGRTSHASIVARELGVPAIVGCGDATQTIKEGDFITVCCSEGKNGIVYAGALPFKETVLDFSTIQKPTNTQVMLIVADPSRAFPLSFYPNDGVGLMRIEFIITHAIQIHPMALVKYDQLKDSAAKEKIAALTAQYANKKQYFIDHLAQGVATIGAAFYPKDVIVRMSDFKTNEYANLLGGTEFEPKEENPMLGFRGASRYYNELYKEGFQLECEAILKVRNEMGLTNVKVMIPFCRTLEEGEKVLDTMQSFGLAQGENGLEVYVMAEIPSNVILAEEFAALFDGFSIGSNDLTQLTLGIDRDSSIISELFSEKNPAAMQMIATVIQKARKTGTKIGLCGQAPSDFPDYARFLVAQGIDSISFNPDALLKGIENIHRSSLKTVHHDTVTR